MSWSSDRTNFDRSIAVVIGINDYQNGIHPLSTPVNDATVLADLLKTEQNYQEIVCLFPPYKEATLKNINELLKETLPNQIRPTQGDRLLFYFAGHGIARNSEDGPAGYLIPQDAQLGKLKTFLPMRDLNAALSQLDCHHLLVILDCCFAGNFRWSSARNVIPVPETIHREHYDRFIRCSAWQAITSAAYNQEALDFLSDLRDTAKNSHHSPFALALIEGLKDNKADLTRDGVITAPELYLYLRDRLIGQDGVSELQTPGLWPLPKHDRGEFIFTLPGFEREQLKPAPPLNQDNNPYRGLQPFDEKHARFFFGRQELVEELYKRISQSEQSSQFIVVVGISGSGKSSLVKAGLIPHLRKNHEKDWRILEPMRPGKSPLIALAKTIFPIANNFSDANKYKQLIRDLNKGESNQLINILTEWVVSIVRAWSQANPQVKLLLTIDQFEELITMSRKATPISSNTEPDTNEQKPRRWLSSVFRRQSKANNNKQPEQTDDVQQEWQQFLALLTNTLKNCPQLHIILTLRSDFEPRFVESAFKDYWDKARFPVRAMRADELREAIEKPASEMALYFEPANSVDRLIDEVGEMPGALPLLSFTLSEFYIKLHQAWVKDGKEDRALTIDKEFYQQGGIAGSLTYRANEIYDGLPDDAHQATMRRVMLRMVEIEGGESVRRRVSEAELNYPDSDENTRVEYVINCLDEARLVVKGWEANEAYVEPAHDFLVKGWNKLQDLIKDEQENLALQRLLTDAALAWEGNNSNVGDLWDNNSRLERLKEIRQASLKKRISSTNEISEENWLNQLETKFVDSSIQRRRNRRFRLTTSLIGVILALSGLAIWALRNAQTAEKRRANAESIAQSLTTENFLASNLQIEALIQGLRTGQQVKQSGDILEKDTQMRSIIALQQVVYEVSERNRLEGHSRWVSSISFSPDGQMIATASEDKTAKLWNRQGQELKTFKGHNGSVNSVSFSPDGQMIATASEDKTVKLWNRQGQELKTFKGHNGSVNSVSFSPDGQIIATASKDKTAKLWNRQGQELKTFKGHNGSVNSVSFSPDGQMIATASRDGTVKLWNRQGQELKTLKEHGGSVNSVSFSPDGKTIAIASDDSTVELWSHQGQKLKTLIGGGDAVFSVSFSPDGQTIASVGGRNGTVKLWNLQGQELKTLTRHRAIILSVGFSPDGQMIATASHQSIKLWNLQGQELKTLPQGSNGSWSRSFSFSPDGKIVAAVNQDSTVRLWNLQGQEIKTLKKQDSKIGIGFRSFTSVSFSPDGKTIASASLDGTIRLWNLQGQQLKTLAGHRGQINSISFSSDGKTIASGGSDNTVKLWNINGQELQTPIEHHGSVNSVSFSPDGKTIASGGDDNTVKLWNGQELKTFTGHRGSVNSVSFSPDGTVIASASNDGTIKLWNLQGEELKTFTEHRGSVKSVSFSPDGKTIASASYDSTVNDSTVKLWNLDLDSLLIKGCSWLSDYLITHPTVLATLEVCQNESNLLAAAPFLVKVGEEQSISGNFDKAIAAFRQALEWNPKLGIDPESKLRQSKALSLINKGKSLAMWGNIPEAIAAYKEAQKLDSKVAISAQSWDYLCFFGSLHKYAADVLYACDKAVMLQPQNAAFRESRGLVREQTGDTQGAIEDIQAFITWTDNPEQKLDRQRWINNIHAGKHPLRGILTSEFLALIEEHLKLIGD